MDVKEYLTTQKIHAGDRLCLSGWLVDKNEGLYILGDHYPEDYAYEYCLKIGNSNIIYQILREVPSLGGGYSLLFHKVRLSGVINEFGTIDVADISINANVADDNFKSINIDPNVIDQLVGQYGAYKFDRPRNPLRDWMDDGF